MLLVCQKWDIHKNNEFTENIDTYKYIWGTWVYHCDYEIALRDCFETYGEDYYGAEDPASTARIYIAISKVKEKL